MARTGVIAAVLALHLGTAQPMSVVTYGDVPQEVVRISLFAWPDEAPPVSVASDVARQGHRVSVRAASGRRSLVLLERADGAYLIDGPFVWPTRDTERVIEPGWRRTIAAVFPEPVSDATGFDWLSAGLARDMGWPRCFRTGDRIWGCWGIAVGEPGVIVCGVLDRTWWTLVSRGPVASLRSSKWGRLLVVSDAGAAPSEVRVRFGRPVTPSSQRVRGVRLDTAIVPGARSESVGPGVAWLFGEDVPADSWIDVRTIGSGPAFLRLQDVADGSSSVPLAVHLDETRAIDGVAVGPSDQRAGAALITLFRLIDPPAPPNGSPREKPRRVLAVETIADAGGAFHLDGIGEADYEIVAWHPQIGRVSSPLPPRHAGALIVRLESPGTIRGRVMAAGKPVAGVEVISLPDPDAVRTADDLVELKGGDARTGKDGRFAVMAAASGGGELRVGGGSFPIKRFPLPRQPVPLLDLGDIDLGAPLEITIVLDQDSACDVRATGPVGQSGLQIVPAARTAPGLFRIVLPEPGLWAFGLQCGRDGRSLTPPLVQITAGQAGKEVRFSVR